MKKKTVKNNLKRFFKIGVTMAFALSAYMGVEASDFVDLEQMIETHSEYELVRNEDGKVIDVNVTNDKVEDDTEMVDFQTFIHLPQWKEYEKFDLTYDKEKQKVFF